MKKPNPAPKRSCDQLGVCQGLSADECPNCTSWECEVEIVEPAPERRPEMPCPTYPFAPGVIEGGKASSAYRFKNARCFPLSLGDSVKLLGLLVALSLAAGYMVERYL